MKTKHYFLIAAPLVLLGSVFAASAQQQDFDLPGRKAPDVPDVPVPEPTPSCVSCPSGYHCNDSADGCEADDPPPSPDPTPEPTPEPQPSPDTTDVPGK